MVQVRGPRWPSSLNDSAGTLHQARKSVLIVFPKHMPKGSSEYACFHYCLLRPSPCMLNQELRRIPYLLYLNLPFFPRVQGHFYIFSHSIWPSQSPSNRLPLCAVSGVSPPRRLGRSAREILPEQQEHFHHLDLLLRTYNHILFHMIAYNSKLRSSCFHFSNDY